MKLMVKHNISTYEIDIEDSGKLADLQEKICELTGVPISGQKIIANGRQINKDPEVPISESGLSSQSKIMVLGRKFDPYTQEEYKKVVAVETQAFLVETKKFKIIEEMGEIKKGFLNKKQADEAAGQLIKRCKGGYEELARLLEKLDAISLAEDQREARMKRKTVVGTINKLMDNMEELQVDLVAMRDADE